jgi:hypothetical protein
MARRIKPGVFCLEGMWTSKLTDRSSVQPILELLERSDVIRYIYRDVGTPVELNHYLDKWLQNGYQQFSTGYLAFHGEAGGLRVGRSWISLDDLADTIDGRGAGRVLYFGACGTMAAPRSDLAEFVRRTKLRAVCGYLREVDWIESAAFEVILIEALTRYKRMDFAEKLLRSNHAGFCHHLGFKMVTSAK